MSEVSVETINTQPKAPPQEATVDLVTGTPAAEPKPAETAADTPPAEAKAEPKELVSQKWAKIAQREARARQAERSAREREAQAAKAIEELAAIKSKKGLELLRALGHDPEEHLSDVLVNGKPDPTRDAVEIAKAAKAEAEELRKLLAERDKREQEQQHDNRLRAGIANCAKFIGTATEKHPYAAKMLEPEEIQQYVYRVHREAEAEGLSLSYEQVGKVVEHYAKAEYDAHERRRAKLAPPVPSDSGPKATRPVNTLTNEDASQSATVGSREESRAERKKRLIAELEARKP
jgi:hypothetical protein